MADVSPNFKMAGTLVAERTPESWRATNGQLAFAAVDEECLSDVKIERGGTLEHRVHQEEGKVQVRE